jgi:hypothetical protein
VPISSSWECRECGRWSGALAVRAIRESETY